jgi:hypothetical protein
MKQKLTFLAVVLSLMVLLVPMPASAAAADAKVYVGHGIPGQDLGLDPALPVDVLVNDGLCLLQGFTFGSFAGPVALAPDTYNLKIKLADPVNPCTGPTAIEANVPFAAGETATVMAHLTDAGAPTASKFVNDMFRLGSFMSRLTVRHTAAAPVVDISANRIPNPQVSLFIEDLANGQQATAMTLRGRYNVALYPANDPNPVFGPFEFFLKPQTYHIVYAVGSLSTGSFTLLTQEFFRPRP